ncbi:LapA family protein [Spirulina subsalsa FACHB-351]|uniref:LapA family protein n=1 Tax=Spirulina subsalsa FACHB-351 TaxID=234711 RepID=A0ABT3L5K0_9CYAN|nr:LapA family protein [Spirulina subsalsa]MCW6036722.1 LapA family protein [Spirulina subsalsa FACHB-351]
MQRQVHALLIVGFIIASLTLIFVLQNPDYVAINFITWEGETPLALLLVITLASGVIIGLICAIPTLFAKNTQIARQKRENKEIQEQFLEAKTKIESQEKRIKYLESHLNNADFNPTLDS